MYPFSGIYALLVDGGIGAPSIYGAPAAPTFVASQGSLCIVANGSVYVNSNGSTTWTLLAAGSGAVTNVTATAPIVSTGGAVPNISFSGIVPVIQGGTGLAAPALVQGSNTLITGTWPDQTIGVVSSPAFTGTVVAGGLTSLSSVSPGYGGSVGSAVIYSGTGVPSITATQGSLFLSSNGNVYINPSGGSVWTQLTAAAGGNVLGIFNALTYGATGNGTTDDTTAVTNTIIAAASAGGMAYFPQGTYLITTPITITTNGLRVNIKGTGGGGTVFVGSTIGLYQPILQINYATGAAAPAGQESGPVIDGITFRQNVNCGGLVLSASGYAIPGGISNAAQVKNCAFDASTFGNGGAMASLVLFDGTGAVISNNYFFRQPSGAAETSVGLMVASTTVCMVTGNQFEGFGYNVRAGTVNTTGTAVATGSHAMTLAVGDFGALGIGLGSQLIIDTVASGVQETVTVTSWIASSLQITATFAHAHGASVPVTSPANQGLQLTNNLVDAGTVNNLLITASIGDTYTGNTFDNCNGGPSVLFTNGQGIAFVGNYVGCAIAASSGVGALMINGTVADVQITANEFVVYNNGNYPLIVEGSGAQSRISVFGNTLGGGAQCVSTAFYGPNVQGCQHFGNAYHGTISSASPIVYSAPISVTSGVAQLVVRNNGFVNPIGNNHAANPSVPGSGGSVTNPFPYDCMVYVSGGSSVNVSIQGQATALASGGFLVKAAASIGMTYSGAPSWQWLAT